MEKLRNINIRNRNLRTAGSIVVASAFILSAVSAEGKQKYVPAPVPDSAFQPVPFDIQEKLDDLRIKVPEMRTFQEVPLSKNEIKVKHVKEEAKKIYDFAKNSGKFNADSLDDLKDNLPFYVAAGEKYDIDWKVLAEIQKRESGASDPKSMAFDKSRKNSRVQGSWQIDISWGEDFARDSYKGLEFLKAFPQRHAGDAVGASEAAHMLRRNLDKYEDLGYEKALFNAMSLYCGADEAIVRIKEIEYLNKVFSNLPQY